MINVIMCGHGNLAVAMKQSIEMVYGKCDVIKTVTFNNHENREILVDKITELLDTKSQTLIVVDLFGGSPFNAASEVAFHAPNIEVITGMSLPLCLEMLNNLDQLELTKLVDYLVEVGNSCVIALQKNLITDDMEDF